MELYQSSNQTSSTGTILRISSSNDFESATMILGMVQLITMIISLTFGKSRLSVVLMDYFSTR